MPSEGQPIFMVCSKCHATWSSSNVMFKDFDKIHLAPQIAEFLAKYGLNVDRL